MRFDLRAQAHVRFGQFSEGPAIRPKENIKQDKLSLSKRLAINISLRCGHNTSLAKLTVTQHFTPKYTHSAIPG